MSSFLKVITVAWVGGVRRRWPIVLLVAMLLSVLCVDYVRNNLGIQTNTADMISPSLDWRQRYIDFQRQFPHFQDTLAIVVDAQSPDRASQAAVALSQALSEQRAVFAWVDLPADSAFFRRHALLFLDEAERTPLIDELINAQPLIGRLNRDPGLKSVAELLNDALSHPEQVDATLVQRFADEMARTLEAVLGGADSARMNPTMSWRALFAGANPPAEGGVTQLIVRAAPQLNYQQLFPAADAMQAVRDTARRLQLTPEHGVRVRITGGLAMSDEELRTVSLGAERAAVFALIGVCVVLLLGLGSVRLVVITLVTLLVGLLWTAAFAALAIGHLNMISVAFAVLYIGLGVDYAVHYALRYREILGEILGEVLGEPLDEPAVGLSAGPLPGAAAQDGAQVGASSHDATRQDHASTHARAHAKAIDGAAGDVGVAIALCALTTGVGFFAFLPTSFSGVSELGLIAGVGMFISLATTLTLMPALMSAFAALDRCRERPPLARTEGLTALAQRARWPGRWCDRLGARHPRAVALAAVCAAVIAAVVASDARFDENPLHLRDARGEAVSTYRELVADNNNWSLDVLVADERAARSVIRQLEAQPEVAGLVWLHSFVPSGQGAALLAIEDLALLLGPDLDGVARQPSAATLAETALATLRDSLAAQPGNTVSYARLARALVDLERRLDAGDAAQRASLLERVQRAVTGTLAGELARMGDALDAQPISVQSLPAELVADWRAPDGRWRVRIDAAQDLNDHHALVAFVTAVQNIAPGAVGAPVVHLRSAEAVVTAFLQAFALALLCITVILYLCLRRVADVLIVLTPLVLAVLLSVAVMVWLDSPFNFANVIALPLLLGVGVDSGIHMLSRARLGAGARSLASSSTARGVVTSALTTTVSFGNLAFSPHPGTASMGLLLTVGMVATLLATLLVLPALVRLVDGAEPLESC